MDGVVFRLVAVEAEDVVAVGEEGLGAGAGGYFGGGIGGGLGVGRAEDLPDGESGRGVAEAPGGNGEAFDGAGDTLFIGATASFIRSSFGFLEAVFPPQGGVGGREGGG